MPIVVSAVSRGVDSAVADARHPTLALAGLQQGLVLHLPVLQGLLVLPSGQGQDRCQPCGAAGAGCPPWAGMALRGRKLSWGWGLVFTSMWQNGKDNIWMELLHQINIYYLSIYYSNKKLCCEIFLPFMLQIIFTCSKFWDGTLITLEFPVTNPKTKE